MMHARQQTRLALKLLAQFLIGKESFLQRDSGIQALIDGFIHRSHAPLSELAHDAIAAL